MGGGLAGAARGTVIESPVVLASASPRRRVLLARVCPAFTVVPSRVDERPGPVPPAAAAVQLALDKARAVATAHPQAVVLGADTIVVLDGELLGKPADPAGAAAMLRRLRGRAHQVVTGVAVVRIRDGRELTAAVASRVTMRVYSEADLEGYVATGEPLDKAGAYAVQEGGAALVARVEGCYTNVVGLPLGTTRRLLAALGVSVIDPG